MSNVRFKTIDFKKRKIRDVCVDKIKIRSVNGHDAIASALRVLPVTPAGQEPRPMEPALFNLGMRHHMLVQCIVEVDGAPVRQPYIEAIDWDSRTREHLAMMYDRVNGMSDKEREDFDKVLAEANDE